MRTCCYTKDEKSSFFKMLTAYEVTTHKKLLFKRISVFLEKWNRLNQLKNLAGLDTAFEFKIKLTVLSKNADGMSVKNLWGSCM
jgi:hypothetical protein